jgi:hypothetical protein
MIGWLKMPQNWKRASIMVRIYEANIPRNLSTPAALLQSFTTKHGPDYTIIEDLILCQAFISASENTVSEAHQKGIVFKGHSAENYAAFIKEPQKGKNLLQQSSDPTREEYIRKGVGILYPERTGDLFLHHFNATIAPEVMKYMGIEKNRHGNWLECLRPQGCMSGILQEKAWSFI